MFFFSEELIINHNLNTCVVFFRKDHFFRCLWTPRVLTYGIHVFFVVIRVGAFYLGTWRWICLPLICLQCHKNRKWTALPLPSVCSWKKSPFMWSFFFLLDFVDDAWRNTWLPYLDVAWDDLEPSWEVKGTLENKCQPSRKQLMNPSLSLINPHTNALFPWGRCFSCFYLVVTLQILPWHKETGRRGNKLRLNVFFPARF